MPPNDAPPSGLVNVAELADLVAHEVNNLLNSVVLHVALLERSLPQGAQAGVQTELGTIRQSIQRAGTMLRRWQQAAPKSGTVMEAVDLSQIIRDLGLPGELRNAAGEKVSLRVQVVPDLPAVLANLDDSRRLLHLLIKSTIEATAKGGTVTLRAQPANGHVLLSVEDQGASVETELLERIFEPFAGMRSALFTRSDEEELWLATCKVLARRQKCAITAAPASAGGLIISVRYPVAEK